MIIRRGRFNIILWPVLLLAVFLVGCSTSGSNKKFSVVRLHLEVNRDISDRSSAVPIYRDKPVMVNVEKDPFLGEGTIQEARVVDVVGGFAVRLKFERRGTWLLEQYTGSNRGKRIAIYGEFFAPPDLKTNVTRWLAAPVITQRISDGVLTFTPDATREEANQLVRGLTKLAKKTADDLKW